MRWVSLRQFTYYTCHVLGIVLIFLSGLVAAALKTDRSHFWPTVGDCLQIVQETAWIGIPVMLLTSAVCKIVCRAVGEPWVWKVLQGILNDYQKNSFRTPNPLHEHRVTLFQHKRYIMVTPERFQLFGWGRMPWHGWLVPVLRSNHTSRRCSSIFLAPDAARHAEGVAGIAWASNGVIRIDDLPELNGDSVRELIGEYARKSFVKEDWIEVRIKKGGKLARSFVAIPIERHNQRWGVLVLDSTAVGKYGIIPNVRLRIATLALIIGKLLERA